MNAAFGSLADEYFVNTRLFLKLDMSLERETVLHFFDQLRKAFPTMRKFHRRDDGSLVLEENAERGSTRRWVRLDSGCLRFGYIAPPNPRELRRLGEVVLDQAPYDLTFSEIDFDHLDVVYGFDLEYRGNHDRLLAETFWADHPLGAFLEDEDARHVIDAQPYLGIALTDDCDLQAYVEIKSRTNTYEVRTNEYESQPLGVFLTVRRYWGLGESKPLVDIYRHMFDVADRLTTDYVVPMMVNPLAQAIASRR